MQYERSSALFKAANEVLPGGVNSPVRAFKSVGGTPIFIKSAKGAYLKDEDGNQYIDYINSWGPMILGHAHPVVTKALSEQIEKGTSFGTPTALETEIAELVVKNVPNIDKVRFVNSGTEATMSAIRLARGFTRRNKIVKFAGCYHGHADAFLIKAGSGAATFGSPNSPGVTQGTAQDTLLATFNDEESVAKLFQENPDEIAAIIIEPVAGNMGCIPPLAGFLEKIKLLCEENNALLIFDEVMTGFRLAKGGTQERLNIAADIVCFGKVIGGGLPVGAFAARNEIMNHLAPEGTVYQAGTLSGNPLAMRAGLTTLKEILNDESIFVQIEKTTQTLAEGITEILTRKNIPHRINHIGSMLSVFFTDTDVIDFETAATANNEIFPKFFHHLLNHGIYLPPSSFETWFIGQAIGEKEINQTLNAIDNFAP